MKRRRQIPQDQQPQDSSTGSPAPGEPVFLAVGRLRRPHGLKGELLMDVLTDFPQRLRAGRFVYAGDARERLEIASVRAGGRREMYIRFAGINSVEEAGRFRNLVFYVKASELPELPEGEYYHHQLLGMAVVNEGGQTVGVLSDILETGANDVYLIKTPDGKELLLPVIEDVILEVDLERKEMRVRLQDWM